MIAREAGINPENIYAFEQDWFRAAVWKKNHQAVGARILESQVGDSTDQSIIILDEFASNHESPTILKIDVEGAELSVLRGFENILANTRPTVYCEVHTGWVQQGTVNEILNLIRDYNYSVGGKITFYLIVTGILWKSLLKKSPHSYCGHIDII